MKTYTGERVVPLGKLKVKVKYESQRRNLELFVLKHGGVPLFGRLDWKEIKSIKATIKQASQCANRELTNILDKHSEVFREGIGTLKHIKAWIELEENAKPRFHKARLFPYALRPKVEAELQHFVDQRILSKVEWSEWAMPIVPVGKKTTDKVRICGDFNVTVNPVIHADQYSLPRTDDIFASSKIPDHQHPQRPPSV